MHTHRQPAETLGSPGNGGSVAPDSHPGGGDPSASNACLGLFVVEDSPVILRSLVAALEEMAPVQVLGHADCAEDAIVWLERHEGACDLVVVDLFLREGSGLDVLRRLARQGGQPARVVLSNYANAGLRRQCETLGAARVLDKSSDIDALVDYCQALAAA